jgi:dihydroxyacetone kinase-like protein
MNMDIPLAHAWITAAAGAVTASADELTRLDTAIGDGDHGTNLTRGFTAVLVAIDGPAATSVGDVLTRTGSTLISKVGGASGPLYGTAFRAIGRALPAAPAASTAELAAALRAGLDALRRLGGAAPGDKTIVDALAPAVDAFAAAVDAAAVNAATTDEAVLGRAVLGRAAAAAAAAAEAGMLATIDLPARKGRASYLGPRSIGHQDPGATSTWLILRALATVTAD